jgi:hypothetical protein
MEIFIWIVAIVLISLILYRAGQLLYKWHRLVDRVGKSIDRYIDSD